MPDPLLTFELSKDRGELVIHGDAAGLRYLARIFSRLADHAASGRSEHDHLMTQEFFKTVQNIYFEQFAPSLFYVTNIKSEVNFLAKG